MGIFDKLNQVAQGGRKPTTAPLDAYPCPHCGQRVSFEEEDDAGVEQDVDLSPGDWLVCPRCRRPVVVQAVRECILLTARPPMPNEHPPRKDDEGD